MPQLLDTTLRDGSYAINFQFTAKDTTLIGAALDAAGVPWIEVGHGIGLGASRAGLGEAAESDAAYLEAAAAGISRARFGVFCIPGIATLADVAMTADLGAGFIRVGTNVTETAEGEPFIRRAKERGLYVAANLMKSYALDPPAFARKAIEIQTYGADVLYIVDSSGGMLPGEVEAYFRAVQEVCDIPLAFHAHNNLGLGVANTLKAVELGGILVDASLQGMGRSAGNAPTEMLVAALDRLGLNDGIKLLPLMDAGEHFVRPLLRKSGVASLDVIAGYAQFHSSYMGAIRKCASHYGVDPRQVIIDLCKVNKVDAPVDLLDRIGLNLQGTAADVSTARFAFDEYVGNEQAPLR